MINCKEFTKSAKEKLKERIIAKNLNPKLTVIQIGNDLASNKYVRGKKKDCEEVGIRFEHIQFDTMVSERTVVNKIRELHDSDGIIVQLPLPPHIRKEAVIDAIPIEKDVDGFNDNSEFIPCTPLGILFYLEANDIKLSGMNAVVIGRSDIVGKPMANQLLDEDCSVTICHSKTKDISVYTKNADLIVVATGHPNTLTGRMISKRNKPIVFDVGINVDVDGKLCGDCDYKSLEKYCKLITPVPGGVGLLTRYGLLVNTCLAAMGRKAK